MTSIFYILFVLTLHAQDVPPEVVDSAATRMPAIRLSEARKRRKWERGLFALRGNGDDIHHCCGRG
jgi:hypothetical protein